VKVPALAADVVVKVNVLLNGGAPEDGLNPALAPVGAVPTQDPLRLTVWAVPNVRLRETVDVALSFRAKVRLLGDALSEKLNASSFIVRVISFVLLRLPLSAVTR
jgi:hypothetical protein